MSTMRASVRLWRGVVHAVHGWIQAHWMLPRQSQERQDLMVQAWASRLLQLWGIELQLRGQGPVVGPMLLVSNHISWLDIVSLHAARHCRFVSKAEVAHWPLIGTFAHASRTLYLHRASRRDTHRITRDISEALRSGDVVAFFPEGTTGNGVELLPFHGNLLQAAIDANMPVQAVALQFIDTRTGALSQAASYVGNESLLGSIWRTLGRSGLRVVVSYGEPEYAQGRDRRTWAADLREQVAALQMGALQVAALRPSDKT